MKYQLPRVCLKRFWLIFLVISNFSFLQATDSFSEALSREQGGEYLAVIRKNYSHLWKGFETFSQNQEKAYPTYDYENAGSFSPHTLRCIKIAGDLQHEFGDLSGMHIVEIGKGSGELCKILADMGGFASYTLVDHPSRSAASKKYLEDLGLQNIHFINASNLDQLQNCDLVISDLGFSSFDRVMQALLLEKVIQPSLRGYMICSYLQSDLMDELIGVLSTNNKKGCLQAENPLISYSNQALAWRPVGEFRPSVLKGPVPCYHNKDLRAWLLSSRSIITYQVTGARIGDQLLGYFHAKWLSMKYGLPFLYQPFGNSHLFRLSHMDYTLTQVDRYIEREVEITCQSQISNFGCGTLININYFPEFKFDYFQDTNSWKLAHFQVDWDDPKFHREIVKCLRPNIPVETLELPSDCLTVAVHVRRGGTFDDYDLARWAWPLKFPPDSYYIEQIQRIAKFFKDKKIYLHIFTDDIKPKSIARHFELEINNPNIVFSSEHNMSSCDLLKDFYSIGKFDCLIRSASNFSIISSLLGSYKIMITPTHFYFSENQIIIDQVETKFKTK